MIQIHTKELPSKKWECYTTINSLLIGFLGESVGDAKTAMRKKIAELKIKNSEIEWLDVEYQLYA